MFRLKISHIRISSCNFLYKGLLKFVFLLQSRYQLKSIKIIIEIETDLSIEIIEIENNY